MTTAAHDVALAARLVAAVHANDVDSTVRVLDEACNDGVLRELCMAVAGQCAGIAGEFYDTDAQQMLDMRAMQAMNWPDD